MCSNYHNKTSLTLLALHSPSIQKVSLYDLSESTSGEIHSYGEAIPSFTERVLRSVLCVKLTASVPTRAVNASFGVSPRLTFILGASLPSRQLKFPLPRLSINIHLNFLSFASNSARTSQHFLPNVCSGTPALLWKYQKYCASLNYLLTGSHCWIPDGSNSSLQQKSFSQHSCSLAL